MKRILIQLDTDPLPSTFDRVVAIDAGVDELFSYGGVTPANVEPLVHGAIFTRGPSQLKHTAIFIGGSQVRDGEALLEKVAQTFFGPMRVSVMMDSNGSNTTAAAAVLSAGKHLDLTQTKALVLGGTGPVGFRSAQLLALQGARVRIGSRSAQRAREACDQLKTAIPEADLIGCEIGTEEGLTSACHGVDLIIGAGAAGAQLLSAESRQAIETLKVAIDLNAVPPLGLEGIEVTDKSKERDGVICYGAIGVGGLKMKIHTAAITALFKSNDQVLDTKAIFEIGRSVA